MESMVINCCWETVGLETFLFIFNTSKPSNAREKSLSTLSTLGRFDAPPPSQESGRHLVGKPENGLARREGAEWSRAIFGIMDGIAD